MHLLARLLLIACILTTNQLTYAQQDSLIRLLEKYPQPDSNRCDAFLRLADFYSNSDTELAAHYADSAIAIAQLIEDEARLAIAYETASNALWYKSDYYQSIDYTKKAISILEKTQDIEALGDNYNALGLNYTFLSQYDLALEFTLKALAIADAKQDSVGKIILLSNTGDLYRQMGDPKQSLIYQQQATELNQQYKIPIYTGIIAYCEGYAYQDLNDYPQALARYDSSLAIGKRVEFNELIHRTLNNTAQIFTSQKKYNKALAACQEALAVAQNMKSKRGETLSLLNMGKVLSKTASFDQAEKHFLQALAFSKSANMDDLSRDIYEALSDLYFQKKDYQKSLLIRKQYEQLKDSIFTIEKTRQIAEVQTLYQTAKKEQENEELRYMQKMNQATIQQQRYQSIALGALALVAFLIGLLIYRNRHNLKKTNALLNQKNDEIQLQHTQLKQKAEEIISQRDFIEEQKNELSLKNSMLTDSIRYAKTIQEALLPVDELLQSKFAAYGIMYQPKDIVSGDFYWTEQIGDKTLLGVIDCTGHGVPGAFMSIIGLSVLNDIVVKNKEVNPANILGQMHQTISVILKQDQSENHDGMDVCLCLIEDKGQHKQITFSGARRPLYYFQHQSEELQVIKGGKRSIGGSNRKAVVQFNNQQLLLEKGARIYLTTDGYVDQHNQNGRKFGSKRFEQLLGKLAQQPLANQIQKLERTLNEFKQNQFQRDDITIVGVEL